jgi:hypothetical protein
MEQTLWETAAKNGIFAILAVTVAYILWKEMRRMSDEARAREERISSEAKTERDRMHAEANAREDRLMSLAEDLTGRFEMLAGQYELLSLDVHEIKTKVTRN